MEGFKYRIYPGMVKNHICSVSLGCISYQEMGNKIFTKTRYTIPFLW